MMRSPRSEKYTVGLVGAGVMGRGIAQIMATAGVSVLLFDTRKGAASDASKFAAKMITRAVEKGSISEGDASSAIRRILVVDRMEAMNSCDVVIEAVVEDLEIKKKVFSSLEKCVPADCILASNTSSLSVTAIAAELIHPGRFAGFHFFNPAPLMKLVEVISGLETSEKTGEILSALAQRVGHEPVNAEDTPGFLVNHAGRGLYTEGIRIVSEGIARFSEVDDLLREGGPGFRMGPFELMDTTGLDVSHPVMESIYNQFYQEPRFRPGTLIRNRLAAGLFGRKTGRGFYRYEDDLKEVTAPAIVPNDLPKSVWIENRHEGCRSLLVDALSNHVAIDDSKRPSSNSLCIFIPFGADVTSCAVQAGVEAERSFAIDMLFGLEGRRTLMVSPVTDLTLADQMHAVLASDGHAVTMINDSPGFVIQRTTAMIANIACDIAQQRIASPADIDKAVRLGLGYPVGPLTMGDQVGPSRLLEILDTMLEFYGDPRYRPSPWLKRRAMLGASLLTNER